MPRKYIFYLLTAIFAMSCATYQEKEQVTVNETPSESKTQQETDVVWQPFKGVLLRHIVANCCFSETENTVVLGQDNDRDQKVDKCYKLKGENGKIFYRIIECPDKLVPVKAPEKDGRLQCRLNPY